MLEVFTREYANEEVETTKPMKKALAQAANALGLISQTVKPKPVIAPQVNGMSTSGSRSSGSK